MEINVSMLFKLISVNLFGGGGQIILGRQNPP